MPEAVKYLEVVERIGIAGLILIFLGYVAHRAINAFLPGYAAAKIEQVKEETALVRTAKEALAKMPATIAEAIGSFHGKLDAAKDDVKAHVDGHAKEIKSAIEAKSAAELAKGIQQLQQAHRASRPDPG